MSSLSERRKVVAVDFDRLRCGRDRLFRFILPKYRIDAKLVLLLNQAAEVMRENLAERFVRHRRVSFRPAAIAEFSLDHRKASLDVRPTMIMLHELITAVLEVMDHLLKQAADAAGRVRLRSDERHATGSDNRFDVGGVR